MKTYSPFFQTIYDESAPVGHLGRGTHYSILRALMWHDEQGRPMASPKWKDFAVVWDEDHDERVIPVLEQLYLSKLLRIGDIYGERKGQFHVLTHDSHIAENTKQDILHIAENTLGNDPWAVNFGIIYAAPNSAGIINDMDEFVVTYVQNIANMWRLGAYRDVLLSIPDEPLEGDAPRFEFGAFPLGDPHMVKEIPNDHVTGDGPSVAPHFNPHDQDKSFLDR